MEGERLGKGGSFVHGERLICARPKNPRTEVVLVGNVAQSSITYNMEDLQSTFCIPETIPER